MDFFSLAYFLIVLYYYLLVIGQRYVAQAVAVFLIMKEQNIVRFAYSDSLGSKVVFSRFLT